jgi:hypothetical protein
VEGFPQTPFDETFETTILTLHPSMWTSVWTEYFSSEDVSVKRLKNMVDVTGIEPVTPCLQRLVALRINNLHQVRRSATDYYKCMIGMALVH